MSMINRYRFAKKLYPKCIILISKKNTYHVFGDDYLILNYLKFKGSLSTLNKYKVDYLILDDLDIVNIKNFEENNYSKYYILSRLNNIFSKLILESFDANIKEEVG